MAKSSKKKKSDKAKISALTFSKIEYYLMAIIIAVTFIVYGNSISNDFAVDDTIVITGNDFVKQGISGIKDILSYDTFAGHYGKDQNMVAGGRYRPLSLITFAVEYSIFGENPHWYHFVNILLYALTGIVLFVLLTFMMELKNISPPKFPFLSVPFITTLFFIVHPIHTEVVANIKGRDEILAFLFSIISLLLFLYYIKKNETKFLILSVISFFLGLLSKENTAAFLLVLPLTAYFFSDEDIKKNYKHYLPYLAVLVLFLIIRQSTMNSTREDLVNDIMNNPFVNLSFFEKYATIIFTLGIYLKLLFVPYQLTYDYYPYHIPIVNFNDIYVLLSLLAVLILLVYAIWKFKTKDIISFSILYYFITLFLVSNIIFPIGVFMNERFVFMSSLGFILALTWIQVIFLPKYFKNTASYFYIISGYLAIILVIFSFMTISRNNDWKDDLTLFTHDVKISINSSKSTSQAGEYLMYAAQKEENPKKQDSLYKESLFYLEKAVKNYPRNVIALFNVAAVNYYWKRNYAGSLAAYKELLKINPNGDNIFTFLFTVFASCKDNDYKIKAFKEVRQYNPKRFDINFNLAELLYANKRYSESIEYYLSALESKREDSDILKKIAYSYFTENNLSKSLDYYRKAQKINPNDNEVNGNISILNSRIK